MLPRWLPLSGQIDAKSNTLVYVACHHLRAAVFYIFSVIETSPNVPLPEQNLFSSKALTSCSLKPHIGNEIHLLFAGEHPITSPINVIN